MIPAAMRTTALAALIFLIACGDDPSDPPDDGATPPDPPADAIAVENAKPGDPGWVIGDYYDGDRTFELYARPLSVTAGQQVDVPMSLGHAASAQWAVYRLGWYGGVGARLVDTGGIAAIGPQAAPVYDDAT